METLIRKSRAPTTAASTGTVRTAPHVTTVGQISSATGWAIPEQTRKFMARLCTNVRPCRAAAAPTTTPNAMMPGATGSPRRIPRTKPDQQDLSGGVSFGAIEESAWVGELGSHGFPHESRWPGQCPAMTTANGEFTLAAEERSHPTAAPAADVACRRAVLRTSVAWSVR